MAKYQLRKLAQNDLAAIWDYTFKNWGTAQAEHYLKQIFQTLGDIANNPQMGRARDDVKPGYRSFPQGRHIIFYLENTHHIEIIGIVHQSADVDKHLSTA